MRLQHLALPPDPERLAKAMIDYLETRPDVDASRIGAQGISMGGWTAPRAASGEPRIKAVVMGSGSLDIGQDLFDYYPPIQDRVRWIIGARDLADARRKLRDYTTDGSGQNIRAAMVIGYGSDDRIMDPQGAYRLVPGSRELEARHDGGTRPSAPRGESRRPARRPAVDAAGLDDARAARRSGKLEHTTTARRTRHADS